MCELMISEFGVVWIFYNGTLFILLVSLMYDLFQKKKNAKTSFSTALKILSLCLLNSFSFGCRFHENVIAKVMFISCLVMFIGYFYAVMKWEKAGFYMEGKDGSID